MIARVCRVKGEAMDFSFSLRQILGLACRLIRNDPVDKKLVQKE